MIRTHGPRETETLLLRRLPRTPRVVAVSAHKTLHVFYGGPDSWLGKVNALTEAEAARLAPTGRPRRPDDRRAGARGRRLLRRRGGQRRAGRDRTRPRLAVRRAVAPSHLATIGEALAGHSEVPFAAAMTGPSNVCASIVCPDAEALYTYLTTRLGRLEGLTSVETTPMIRVIKREGTLLPHPAR